MSERIISLFSIVELLLEVKYVSGKENCVSDYLSHWHFDTRFYHQFEDLTEGSVPVDTPITDDLFCFTLLQADFNNPSVNCD